MKRFSITLKLWFIVLTCLGALGIMLKPKNTSNCDMQLHKIQLHKKQLTEKI